MKHTTILLLGGLLTASTLQAEVPVMRDQVLMMENTVVFSGNEPAYYGDIRMRANADGTFSLVGAERRPLAPVSTAQVRIAESYPVQVSVQVTGTLSVACVALEEVSVTRNGTTFHVVLAETTMPPGSVCMSLVATTPYEVNVPLNVTGLPAGNYTVNVNGRILSFTL